MATAATTTVSAVGGGGAGAGGAVEVEAGGGGGAVVVEVEAVCQGSKQGGSGHRGDLLKFQCPGILLICSLVFTN